MAKRTKIHVIDVDLEKVREKKKTREDVVLSKIIECPRCQWAVEKSGKKGMRIEWRCPHCARQVEALL